MPSREDWVVRAWPKLLIMGGLAIFWASCLWSAILPPETFYVGPTLMLAGVVLTVINREAP